MTVPEPPSQRIVTEIRRRIAAGDLRPGDRVPSTRQLTRDFGVAMATATKALSSLQREGLVRGEPGRGTRVASAEPRHGAPQARATRRREPRVTEHGLTRERLVQVAIDIADAEGLAALSMRRVAAELDAATMSLYRYVPGKDDLLLLMIDAVFGKETLPDPPPPGWRAQLEVVARLQWALYRRHPWLAQVAAIWFSRPSVVPRAMAHTEWSLRALDELGLDPSTMFHLAVLLASFVHGVALQLASGVEAEHETGVTSDEWIESQMSAMTALFSAGGFPMLARITAPAGLEFDLSTLFEFGLPRLLDGFAVLVSSTAVLDLDQLKHPSTASRTRTARLTK